MFFIKGKSGFSRTRVKRNAFSLMGIKILPFKKQQLESIKIARKDFLEACLKLIHSSFFNVKMHLTV